MFKSNAQSDAKKSISTNAQVSSFEKIQGETLGRNL